MTKVKIFYDHLIEFEEIEQVFDSFELDQIERDELIRVTEETVHIRVLDLVLKFLPKTKHEIFLTKFHQAPDDEKLMEMLIIEADVNIETHIRNEAKKVKGEILKEIQLAGKK